MYQPHAQTARQRLTAAVAVGAIQFVLGAALLGTFAGGTFTRAIDKALVANTWIDVPPPPRPIARTHADRSAHDATTAPQSAEPGLALDEPFIAAPLGTLPDLGGLGEALHVTIPHFAPPAKPVAAHPLGDPGLWITTDDYPARALREGWSGVTRLHLVIDALGSVVGCDVLQSSGHPELDRVACDRVTSRARFAPARDGDGHASEGHYDGTIRWQIHEAPAD